MGLEGLSSWTSKLGHRISLIIASHCAGMHFSNIGALDLVKSIGVEKPVPPESPKHPTVVPNGMDTSKGSQSTPLETTLIPSKEDPEETILPRTSPQLPSRQKKRKLDPLLLSLPFSCPSAWHGDTSNSDVHLKNVHGSYHNHSFWTRSFRKIRGVAGHIPALWERAGQGLHTSGP